MTFKETLDSLKGKIQAMINGDSTPEQITEINGLVTDLDSLETAHKDLETENAKFKDTIVRMVSTQGDGQKPGDESSGSKPMTIEEACAQVSKGGK